MKKISLILLTLLVLKTQAQDNYPRNAAGKIEFDKTISVARNKERLLEGVNEWISTQGFSTQEKNVQFNQVITYQNIEQGKIFGNGKFKFDTKYAKKEGGYDYKYMSFLFKIYVKDNEYRYVFTDFKVNGLTWHKRNRTTYKTFEDYIKTKYYRKFSRKSIKEHFDKLENDLKLAMQDNL